MTEKLHQFESNQALPLTAPSPADENGLMPERPNVSEEHLRADAISLSTDMVGLNVGGGKKILSAQLHQLSDRLVALLHSSRSAVSADPTSPALELLENSRMFEGALASASSDIKSLAKLPIIASAAELTPRIFHIAIRYIATVDGIWSPDSLHVYVLAAQGREPLQLDEVLSLGISLQLAQLQLLLDRGEEFFASKVQTKGPSFSALVHSLRRMEQMDWPELLEKMIVFNDILAEDPAGAFLSMDEESRGNYRARVAKLAKRSNLSEVETAAKVVAIARDAATNATTNWRLTQRTAHVGYYLFEEGFPALAHAIGYHPHPGERLRELVKRYREDLYVLSIFTLSTLLIAAFIAPIVPHNSFVLVIAALLLALLPATVGASDLINSAVTSSFPPRTLPKLNYQENIPQESATFVVVPILLLHEAQVREAVDELEARYLANSDANLHFGLLTDLPDSKERPQHEDRNELVELAIQCTLGLNEKYRHEGRGSFLLLHRHRVFNTRQGVWMGWERKRGKLLDLNKLLMGAFDSFPIKAGPTEILSRIRYVITLDSDTQLPRGSAARMIGAIAHPLNQAIIDPDTRIVKHGYGILQPRVGVSVASASRSRLASLYSGETGFDIYTRAVSDVYQDLFGEGIFTGKGIYEAAILHEVLDRRFPKDSLLSHDLIEGSYARVGLVTDIEVIDDYPSHYSAHTRRKHRWLRGDWQLLRWLFTRVPDESGELTLNPTSLISRWKMVDNLRRSLVEPITFLLFVLGWLVLPGGPVYWTFVLLTLLMLPAFVQLGFQLGRAVSAWNSGLVIDALRTFFTSLGVHLLNLAFLAHQTLLSLDAIVRSLVRGFLTGERLLEWETAAQSEAKRAQSTLDRYLQISSVIAFVLAGALIMKHPRAAVVASPILVLWIFAPAIAVWLDSSPRKVAKPLSKKNRSFLEEHALRLWQYFAEFGGPHNMWLIPDNVEEQGLHQTRKLSPTNLGMLFNARQAAMHLGFITLPEFVEASAGTFTTYERLEKMHGHIFNWYDIETLRPIAPVVVSTVDSGNLAASLYALHGGALDLLKAPLLDTQLFLALSRILERNNFDGIAPPGLTGDTVGLIAAVSWIVSLELPPRQTSTATAWQIDVAYERRDAIIAYITEFTPWLLPRFTPLFSIMRFRDPDNEIMPPLHQAASYIRRMDERLTELHTSEPDSSSEALLIQELRQILQGVIPRVEQLERQMCWIASEAERHADAMQYGFLLVASRQLLSIAYDAETRTLNGACYDLLASEARIASFLAVAKGDVPQRAWFRLDRTHTLYRGRATLLSWTGTMFEYLMPSLWMRSYPDTLITRSLEAAIAIQKKHVRGMPWGISESGYAKTDAQGRYSYQAWGIPGLALKYEAKAGPVISPYSSFLAMPFVRDEALANLRSMSKMDWVGEYGFYEAADYIEGKVPRIVRSWMAHHQGMSLLATTNLLCGNVFQRWFHANPKVRAAELLLHEKPLSRQAVRSMEERGEIVKTLRPQGEDV
jgi:cyclic beta-1,2-glucan synthetase